MASEEQLAVIRQGPKAWNAWRREHPGSVIDLRRAHLPKADLTGADLRGAKLIQAFLFGAHLGGADLHGADLSEVYLSLADLRGADLRKANLTNAHVGPADLSLADLRKADLGGANLSGADLRKAHLYGAHFDGSDLRGADLRKAFLQNVILVSTKMEKAKLTGCYVYGISTWNLNLEDTEQTNLIITKYGEPEITVDKLEVAQFVYLLLHNEKLRDVIDTLGKKGVLLLGRFTEGRLTVLERLRDELRQRGFLPMVFNFDKPETKDFTETVRLLAGLSRFVIVDITNPRSAPLELQAAVPEYMIPFVPILEKGEEPFALFQDLWNKHRAWVLDPIRYPSVERLVEVLDAKIIRPAEARFAELLARKAEALRIEDV